MKKLLLIAALAIPLFIAASGSAQSLSDTLTLSSVSLPTSVNMSNETGTFTRASGGYIYNGPGFGGTVFVGPRFRQTNPTALRNENNGIEHGNNLCLFPSSCGNELGVIQGSTKITTVKMHKGMMLRKGTLIKMRRTKRVNRVITPTSI